MAQAIEDAMIVGTLLAAAKAPEHLDIAPSPRTLFIVESSSITVQIKTGLLYFILAAIRPDQSNPHYHIHVAFFVFAICLADIDWRCSPLPLCQFTPYRYTHEVQPPAPWPGYSVPLYSGVTRPLRTTNE